MHTETRMGHISAFRYQPADASTSAGKMAAWNRGFSLIELMIAVAIIAVLAAIAVPNYNNYLIKGKLTEAYSQLSDLQNRQEQYYQDNRAYKDGMTVAAGNYFSSSCTSTGQAFTCTATPTATGIGFRFTVNEAGTKTTIATATALSGWTVPSTNCWARDKSGAC